MYLYLVRHGDAATKEADGTRSLTEMGRAESERVARWLARVLTCRAPHVFHSEKARAAQTAGIIAKHFRSAKLEADRDLVPDADPALWVKRLGKSASDVVLVGHFPHLNRLASRLITGHAEPLVIALEKSGVACLVRDDNRNWALCWLVQPSVLGT
jgi:phosphohistidine phosphatase